MVLSKGEIIDLWYSRNNYWYTCISVIPKTKIRPFCGQ